jgi:hypothetical protein
VWLALLPWIIVCAILLLWGTNWFKGHVNPWATWNYAVPELDKMINKVAPIVSKPTPESAVFGFTWLSYTGSGMLIAAIISGLLLGFSPVRLVTSYARTIKVCAYSLITISAMLAIGTLTRLSGIDATLGLAFAATGVLYPFFGTPARLARRRAHGLRHGIEHSVRQSAEDHLRTARALADPDGRRELVRRRDGQDDRCAVDRRRLHGHQLVRPRRHHPALRVLAFDRACLSRRLSRDAAGLRVHRHDRGRSMSSSPVC